MSGKYHAPSLIAMLESLSINDEAGPKMREPVITVVFNDIAFGISDDSTSSVTKPRRDGLSIALAMPVPNDKR